MKGARFYVRRGQMREAVPGAQAVGVQLPGEQGVEFLFRQDRLQVYASDRLAIAHEERSNVVTLRLEGIGRFSEVREPTPDGELRNAAKKAAGCLKTIAWDLEQSNRSVFTAEDRKDITSLLRRLAESLEGRS